MGRPRAVSPRGPRVGTGPDLPGCGVASGAAGAGSGRPVAALASGSRTAQLPGRVPRRPVPAGYGVVVSAARRLPPEPAPPGPAPAVEPAPSMAAPLALGSETAESSGFLPQNGGCIRSESSSGSGSDPSGSAGEAPSRVRLVLRGLRRRAFLVRTWATLLAVRAALVLVPFARLRAVLERFAVPRRRLVARAAREPRPVHRLARAVARAGRWVPSSKPCLTQALVLDVYLRRRGLASRIAIGVAREGEGIAAHAWVESGGEVVLGGANRDQFTELTAGAGPARGRDEGDGVHGDGRGTGTSPGRSDR